MSLDSLSDFLLDFLSDFLANSLLDFFLKSSFLFQKNLWATVSSTFFF